MHKPSGIAVNMKNGKLPSRNTTGVALLNMTVNTKANFAPLMDDQNVEVGDEEDNISQPTIISCPWSMENTKKRFVLPVGDQQIPKLGAP